MCIKKQRSQMNLLQVPCQSYFFVKKESVFSKKTDVVYIVQ